MYSVQKKIALRQTKTPSLSVLACFPPLLQLFQQLAFLASTNPTCLKWPTNESRSSGLGPARRSDYTYTPLLNFGIDCARAMADKAPPSLTAVAVSSLILGLLAGYFIGQGSSIGVFGGSGSSQQAKMSWPNSYDVKVHADSSDDQADDEDEADEDNDEDGDGKELKDFEDSSEEVKLVLGVRTDLGMGKGEEEVLLHIGELPLILCCSQARLQLNAPMQPWPASDICSTMSPRPPCSSDGNGEDSLRLRYKSSLRRSWRHCRHKQSALVSARGLYMTPEGHRSRLAVPPCWESWVRRVWSIRSPGT